MPPTTSEVWNYCTKLPTNEILCNLCEQNPCKNCSEGSPCKLKGVNASNAKKHLRFFHPDEHEIVREKDIEKGLINSSAVANLSVKKPILDEDEEMRESSAVWDYFTKLADTSEILCKVCEENTCRKCTEERPCKLQGFSASNAKRHLQRAHPEEYSIVEQRDNVKIEPAGLYGQAKRHLEAKHPNKRQIMVGGGAGGQPGAKIMRYHGPNASYVLQPTSSSSARQQSLNQSGYDELLQSVIDQHEDQHNGSFSQHLEIEGLDEANENPLHNPSPGFYFQSREEVTKWIQAERIRRALTWSDIAQYVGMSKEWTTAACLGQMRMNKDQAESIAELFGLGEEACAWLQTVPMRGSSGGQFSGNPPSDPTLYRFHEVLNLYGGALKELIHEEFGDGIMSAVDFKIHLHRSPEGRVQIIWDGKFLPYSPF